MAGSALVLLFQCIQFLKIIDRIIIGRHRGPITTQWGGGVTLPSTEWRHRARTMGRLVFLALELRYWLSLGRGWSLSLRMMVMMMMVVVVMLTLLLLSFLVKRDIGTLNLLIYSSTASWPG